MTRRALHGLTVVDLSRHLPGPYLTRLLADLGASVTKVEPPTGDPLNTALTAPTYAALNHHKERLCLDLKLPPQQEQLWKLLDKSDVVVESFRPGVLERLGFGWTALQARNPRLILCSLTGYGQSTERSARAGHDLNYLGLSGLLSLFSSPTAYPPGAQVADLAGGSLSGAVAILAALLQRQHTGLGQHLDISMSHGCLPLELLELKWQKNHGTEVNPLRGWIPAYRSYKTADNKWMTLAALEPQFFLEFCRAAHCEELAISGLAQGQEGVLVQKKLETIFLQRTQKEWVEVLKNVDACCEPVLEPLEAVAALDAHDFFERPEQFRADLAWTHALRD